MQLLARGVKCRELFASNIFYHPIRYFEWTNLNPNDSKYSEPYNGPIFNLRK